MNEMSIKKPVARSTNLEFLRFIAAALVIFSHSFPITQGIRDNEWIYHATGGQLDFGALAVAFFFLCGGYLGIRSLDRCDSVFVYIKKRLLRMLPVLWVVIIFTVIVGAFISTCTFTQYFTDIKTYKYLLNMFMIPQYNLPGVFEDAVYLPVVNGALWTLPLEFGCNVASCIALKLGLLKERTFKFTIPIVLIIAAVPYFLMPDNSSIRDIIRPCVIFYAGMLLYRYGHKIRWSPVIAALCVILLPISSYFGVLYFGMIVLFPYIFIYLCFYIRQGFKHVSIIGRYSYSIYLWAFPIQQIVAMCFGWKTNPYYDTLISLLIACAMSVLSYHLVEERVNKKAGKKSR